MNSAIRLSPYAAVRRSPSAIHRASCALENVAGDVDHTNAPAAIGTNVIFGCMRLDNDDVVDLSAACRTARWCW
jgi:hypothetical protein